MYVFFFNNNLYNNLKLSAHALDFKERQAMKHVVYTYAQMRSYLTAMVHMFLYGICCCLAVGL